MNGCQIYLGQTVPSDVSGEEFNRAISISQVLASEIEGEIFGHFRDTCKEGRAKRARAIIASLIEADGKGYRLLRVELKTVVRPFSSNEILGADSVVDRLLIGYGIDLLKNQNFAAVFIASADGGIKLEVAKLRSQVGLELFVIEDMKPSSELKSVLNGLTEGIRAFKRSAREQEELEARRKRFRRKMLWASIDIATVFILAALLVGSFGLAAIGDFAAKAFILLLIALVIIILVSLAKHYLYCR